MYTFLKSIFRTLFLKIDLQNVFVNPISSALEVTKQWHSRCICWKFSIWFKFDSENVYITILVEYIITILVEYIQQVIALKLIEFIQSN